MTATFDASGCPSEFIAVARQLEADIEDKMNLIAKENQLIEGCLYCNGVQLLFNGVD